MNGEGRVALVTGGNRGIGLEVCRSLGRLGYDVRLGARDAAKGDEAVAALAREGLVARPVVLDVSDPRGIDSALAGLERIDVLVNNAGVMVGGGVLGADLDAVREQLQINVLGPWQLAQVAAMHMRGRGWGRIVNVSSEAGSLATGGSGYAPYRLSKTLLNALTRQLAFELEGTGVLVNAACPGWVASDMGGVHASRSLEQGAASVVWAVEVPDDGPSGGFFRDGEPLAW